MAITNQDIIDTRTDITISDAQAGQYLATANALLNSFNLNHPTDLLDEITKYLALHFSCVDIPVKENESVSGISSAKYQGRATADNLKSTSFGQTACLLDTTGTLARLGTRGQRTRIMGPNNGTDNPTYYDVGIY